MFSKTNRRGEHCHHLGTHTPDGTPIGAIYAARAQQQPTYYPSPPVSAEEMALRNAVEREGAVCQLGQQPCGVAAVGRCHECSQTFCYSHRSFARPSSVAKMRLAYFDWCRDCQDRHVEQAEAKAAQQREAAKLREQEAERAHAAAIAAHERRSGWDPQRDYELEQLIASSSRSYQKPAGIGFAVAMGAVAFAGFAVLLYAVMTVPNAGGAGLGGLMCCSIPLLAMSAWPIYYVAALAAWRRREGWIFERQSLRKLRGCGVVGCQRCRR